MREYSKAYIFHQRGRATQFFGKLEDGIGRGIAFPFSAPHEIAVVSGPAADFVAVLVQLEHARDESINVGATIDKWFEQCGAGRYDDWEALSAPIPGRAKGSLRATLGSQYRFLGGRSSLGGSAQRLAQEARVSGATLQANESKACDACAGTGKIPCGCKCQQCSGGGFTMGYCPRCKSTSVEPCLLCRGTGKTSSTLMFFFKRVENCSRCDGRGKVKCGNENCLGGKARHQCTACRGSGFASSCKKCSGTGTLPCTVCAGSGLISVGKGRLTSGFRTAASDPVAKHPEAAIVTESRLPSILGQISENLRSSPNLGVPFVDLTVLDDHGERIICWCYATSYGVELDDGDAAEKILRRELTPYGITLGWKDWQSRGDPPRLRRMVCFRYQLG